MKPERGRSVTATCMCREDPGDACLERVGVARGSRPFREASSLPLVPDAGSDAILARGQAQGIDRDGRLNLRRSASCGECTHTRPRQCSRQQ